MKLLNKEGNQRPKNKKKKEEEEKWALMEYIKTKIQNQKQV